MLNKKKRLRFCAAVMAGLMSAGLVMADISVAMAAPPPPPHKDGRKKPPPQHRPEARPAPHRPGPAHPPPPSRPNVRPQPGGPHHPAPPPPRPNVRPPQPSGPHHPPPPRPNVRPQPSGPHHPPPNVRPQPGGPHRPSPPPPGPGRGPHHPPPPPGPGRGPHHPPPPPPERSYADETVGSLAGLLVAGLLMGAFSQPGPSSYDRDGVKAYKEGDKTGALELFNKAINLNDEYYDAYLHRSAVYYDMGEYDKSMTDVEKCINFGEKKYPEAFGRRAQIKQIQGEPVFSILMDYNRAIQFDPKNPTWYVERARINRNMEREEKALEDFNTAIALSKGSAKDDIIRERDHFL